MSKEAPFERDPNMPVRLPSERGEKGSAMETIRSDAAQMREKTRRLREQRLAREASKQAGEVLCTDVAPD